MAPQELLPLLLGLAVLAPLASFFLILAFGPNMGKGGRNAAHVSIAAILTSAVCAFVSLVVWCGHHWPTGHEEGHHADHAPAAAHAASSGPASNAVTTTPRIQPVAFAHVDAHGHAAPAESKSDEKPHAVEPPYTGDYYVLATFGKLRLTISYYIDALTICMFCMVTLIASCIHFYASGYMHDELHDFEDPEVPAPVAQSHGGHGDHGHGHEAPHAGHAHNDHAAHHGDAHGHDEAHGHDHGHAPSGRFLVRPGRYHRFFQAMSLFCFSMLGLVLAGNIAMVFCFWELVGICSYFLIGFYVERNSASTAANKAFIVNRVGDFGMIIGLMALWSGFGTFAFGDIETKTADGHTQKAPGMFSLARPGPDHKLVVPEGMALVGRNSILAKCFPGRTPEQYGYWLMIVGGVGIFCGCVGKSAQFPLHTWLPDAMEGPTPVSALVHSATMVAAGVYLVGRFYPMFTPEVLLVIASCGAITLFMAATIAITATDIKRVLAYSTISQLGYMMLALGLGGWLAGLMHLITHAFFKSLLFLCSGSVIHAVHTNEMTLMGGLRKKMPITAYTMLVGCLAIAGAGIPFLIGFSGYYSKDAILEQALLFSNTNRPWGSIFFAATAAGAAITAFYMFRLWFMTFAGEPRDQHRYDHAHESPAVMYVPLIVLSVFAVGVAWQPFSWSPITYPTLANLLEHARPVGTLATTAGEIVPLTWPNEHLSHAWDIKTPATWLAFFTALGGVSLAAVFYGVRWLDAGEARAQFQPIYHFLRHKWWFDELYNVLFVQPTLLLGRLFAWFDRRIIDGLIDLLAWCTRVFAVIWETVADRTIVDGAANLCADWTWSLGSSLRNVQTGRLRQYVMFIVVGTVALFVVISFFWRSAQAG